MDLLTLSITGAVVSLLVQWIKNTAKTSEYVTLGMVVVLSLLAGAFYYYFKGSSLLTDAYQILIMAGAVYTFLIQRVEAK